MKLIFANGLTGDSNILDMPFVTEKVEGIRQYGGRREAIPFDINCFR